ncbi:hypothetical protein [Microcystis phage Mel-JY01]
MKEFKGTMKVVGCVSFRKGYQHITPIEMTDEIQNKVFKIIQNLFVFVQGPLDLSSYQQHNVAPKAGKTIKHISVSKIQYISTIVCYIVHNNTFIILGYDDPRKVINYNADRIPPMPDFYAMVDSNMNDIDGILFYDSERLDVQPYFSIRPNKLNKNNISRSRGHWLINK